MNIEIGDVVKFVDLSDIPKQYIKLFEIDKEKEYIVRGIGERTGGVRLEEIELYSDFTGYEKCFRSSRFEIIKHNSLEQKSQDNKTLGNEWFNALFP